MPRQFSYPTVTEIKPRESALVRPVAVTSAERLRGAASMAEGHRTRTDLPRGASRVQDRT
jgi:hypothetical protein